MRATMLGMSWKFAKARELKQKHGRKTDWLARECGVETKSMRNMLRGSANPSRSVLLLMAQALECSVDDLSAEEPQTKKAQ